MNDQLAVRILNRGANLQAKLDSLAQSKLIAVAPLVDGFAIDILHHQVWRSILKHSAIKKPGNQGMIQQSQNLPLFTEAALIVI